MRIKYYREFDPTFSEKDEIFKTLNEILLELPEEHPNIEYNLDYEWAKRVSIGYHDLGMIPAKIKIIFSGLEKIKYKDIEDYIIRVSDYLKSIGLRLIMQTAFGDDYDNRYDDWKEGKINISDYRIVFSI